MHHVVRRQCGGPTYKLCSLTEYAESQPYLVTACALTSASSLVDDMHQYRDALQL
jgi:hypothetical protein